MSEAGSRLALPSILASRGGVGWSTSAAAQISGVDEPAGLPRIQDTPSPQIQKGSTKGASREQIHTTQLVGVAGK